MCVFILVGYAMWGGTGVVAEVVALLRAAGCRWVSQSDLCVAGAKSIGVRSRTLARR